MAQFSIPSTRTKSCMGGWAGEECVCRTIFVWAMHVTYIFIEISCTFRMLHEERSTITNSGALDRWVELNAVSIEVNIKDLLLLFIPQRSSHPSSPKEWEKFELKLPCNDCLSFFFFHQLILTGAIYGSVSSSKELLAIVFCFFLFWFFFSVLTCNCHSNKVKKV